MALIAGIVQPALPASLAALQPLVGAPQSASAAGEALRITKIVTTTDGSSVPAVSGTFNIQASCVVTPANLSAGGSVTFSDIASGTVCAASENTLNLPAAPVGYTWAGWTSSAPVTVLSNQTSNMTVTNFLAPLNTLPGSVLTVTKQINGPAIAGRVYTMTVTGPNSYNNTVTLTETAQLSHVLTGLTPGIYTVTEQSPGAGWVTTYSVTSGAGIASTANAVLTLTNVSTATRFTPTGPLTGTVYNDFNSDGNITANGTITDTGVQSVTVSAYDMSGNLREATTTDASGRYTFTVASLDGVQGPYRVEFTNLPANYEPARVFTGTNNGTSVQFVNADTAAARTLNFGVVRPCDYCQDNPQFATTVNIVGDQKTVISPTVVEAAFLSGATNFSDFGPFAAPGPNGTGNAQPINTPGSQINVANSNQVGTVKFAAYDPPSNNLLVASHMKRFAGFPGATQAERDAQLGTIWMIDRKTNPNTVKPFFVGNAGIDIHNYADSVLQAGVFDANGLSIGDLLAQDRVGVSGWGDIDVAPDGSALYAVNLFDQKIYRIAINRNGSAISAGAVTTFTYPTTVTSQCSNGNWVPGALKVTYDRLLTAVTCAATTSQLTSDLKGLILSTPLSAITSGAPVWSVVANVRFDYPRQEQTSLPSGHPSDWRPWKFPVLFPSQTLTRDDHQPHIVDLELDDNGNLLISVNDRLGDMVGVAVTSNTNAYVLAAGDLLRATPTVTGTYIVEYPNPATSEFFLGDGYNDSRAGGDNVVTNAHRETMYGGIAVLPGAQTVLGTSNRGGSRAGMRFMSTTDGSFLRFATFGQTTVTYPMTSLPGDGFYKANAMGDTELLCDPAPIEIGNRVWNDVNRNGVQDAGEPGINGVQVTLSWTGGSINTTTSVDGNYYFTREAATGIYSRTLAPNKTYTITFGVPAGYSLTVPNAQALAGASVSSNHAISDVRDSDAVLIANVPTILYTTGKIGQNNHGLDVGYVQPVAASAGILNTAPPKIAIEKYTNGFDGNLGNEPFIRAGQPVTWTYVFTNTGGVTLTNFVVTDTPAGAVTGCTPSLSGLQLAPGGRVTCTLGSTATVGLYRNTVVVTGTSVLTGQPVTDTEDSGYIGANPSLVLRKYTNGYDADTLPLSCNGVPAVNNQPCVPVGSTVTWTYIVTNTGNMTLTFAINALTDDKVGPINTSSAFTLTPGATTTYTKTGFAVAGQYTNTAIVTGTPVLPPSVPITPDIPFTPTLPVTNPLTSTNPSHYFATDGKIVLRKYTNGYDADTLPLSCNGVPAVNNQPCVPVGSTVTWTYQVTNTGNVSLSVAAGDLRDDKVGSINASASVLNVGETRTFTATGIAVAGQYTNTAVVTGTNVVLPLPVTSTNPSHYFGDVPGISLRKYTNGFDADNITGPYISLGQPVTWTFVARNTGTTALTMTLTDDKLGVLVNNGVAQAGVVCTPVALNNIAPGGVVTCTKGGIATLGQYTNMGVVTGTPPVGTQVSSTNPSNYFGALPQILLRKYTNGYDADTLADPRPVLPPNAAVVWTYIITNTGNMTLVLALTDDRISTAGATCAPVALGGQLAAGGMTTCTLPGTALVAQTTNGIYTNTGVVTGTPVLPLGTPITPDISFSLTVPVTNPVTSTNPSHYEVYPQFGDRVWLESDGDGVVGTGYIGPVAGMVITATNGVITYVTTTDSNGYYSFTVSAGTYTVTYGAMPAAYGIVKLSATPAGASAIGNAGAYQGGNDQSRPQNATVSLTAGQTNWTMDFAFTYRVDVGNRVWADTNNNGALDASEVGIPNVAVWLQTPTTTLTTLTDPSGYYSFTNLPVGVYTPVIAASNFQPAGVLGDYISSQGATSTYNAADNNRDHGVDPANLAGYGTNGVSGAPVTLGPLGLPVGEDVSAPATPNGDANNNLTADFGFYRLVLGNQVWEDNGAGGGVVNNGVRDGAEPGIAGVTVTLWSNSVVVSTTVTDASGLYGFTGLMSGTYSLSVQLPAGYVSSKDPITGGNPDNQTDDDDNGIGTGSGLVRSPAFNMTPGAELNVNNATGTTTDPTLDFGAWKPSGLGNYVWYDLNNDGVQNNGPLEIGVAGITVTLYANGVPVSTTVTDVTGYYIFTGLVQGTYSVTFGIPGSLNFTVPSAVAPDASDTDSDAKYQNGQTGGTDSFTLGYGEFKPQIDAGVWRPAGLGDTIWIDTNANGLQDTGEPGLPGVMATLYQLSPTSGTFVQISQTTTGSGGYYEFSNLVSGTYQVIFDLPIGYTWTLPLAGSPIIDSNVITSSTGGTAPVSLMENEFNPTIDGGLVSLLVNLGNQVWFDTNDNGLRDATEVGIGGVRVELYRDSDSSGAYTPGVDAFVDARTTEADGTYTFLNLTEGRYVVVLPGTNFSAGAPLAGYRSSTTTELDANANVDDNDNGVEVGVSGMTPAYVASSAIDLKAGSEPSQRILPGDSNWTVDFGFFRLWLGGTVWLDVNYDGLLNDGAFAPGNPFVPSFGSAQEPGMPNIAVELLDASGKVLATTTTDAAGAFNFAGLLQGSYTVRITAPDGKRSTMDVSTTADPNNDVDNDDNGIGMNFGSISSGLLTLVPGVEPIVDNNSATSGNPTLDFGLVTGPLLVVRKTNNTQSYVRPNDLITYTLTVTNIGVTLVRNVMVSDFVPANTTFVSASSVPAVPIQTGPPVVWRVGDMPPGAVFVGTFTVRVFAANLNANVITNVGTVGYENTPTETVSVPTNEVVNPLAPTAVTLASFSAQAAERGVNVTWQTALERNTFAFNVLRSATGRREDAVQVNASPLPAIGPSTYSFVDEQGSAGNSYWIEEIELSGWRNAHGPAVAQAALAVISQPAQQVIAPPAVQAPAVDAVGGVVGGGVSVAQPAQPVAQPQAASPAQPATQGAAAAPAQPAVAVADAQSAPTQAQPQAQLAAEQSAAAPAQPANEVQPVVEQVQPAIVAQPAAQSQDAMAQPVQPAQAAPPAAEQVVVGAQSGVNVARGGGQMLPPAPRHTPVVAEPVPAAQPMNPLLPLAAGALALLGIGGAGVFVVRRHRKTKA